MELTMFSRLPPFSLVGHIVVSVTSLPTKLTPALVPLKGQITEHETVNELWQNLVPRTYPLKIGRDRQSQCWERGWWAL